MLDINYLREHPDEVKKVTQAKNRDPKLVDRLLKVDETRRQLIIEIEGLRQQRHQVKREEVEKGRQLKELLRRLEPDLKAVEEEFYHLLYQLPNLVSDDTPIGKDESGNQVIRHWGEPPKFSFKPKDHLELGESLDLIDTATAATVTGSRFGYLKNEAVGLEFALIHLAFDLASDLTLLTKLAKKAGVQPGVFTPVVPPVMIKPEVFTRMARLSPQDEDERYYFPKDNLYLVGSAEHTLGPLHLDQTLAQKDLPRRYVGFSTAFRREAGSYGKDVRGIFRVHQFDKVEMETFCLPEDSLKEQLFLVSLQEHFLQSLKIPYQVVSICTGDMGAPDYRQFDLEAWIPSQNKYRETHTSDLMTDYQSRRLKTKVLRPNGQTEFVHMNDATLTAIGRTLIAILENYQQADGSVLIPEVLRKYLGREKISPRK